MVEIHHQKLVRDKIPDVISGDGQTAHVRILDDVEYRRRLFEKLVEEAQELLNSDGDPSERADVQEVLQAIDIVLGLDAVAVEALRKEKHDRRGGFADKIFLEKVETND